MRDKDSGDCVAIKKGLVEKVNRSGKLSRSIIRIACAELESFYLGDLLAVENGLNVPNLARRQNERKFRNPDERTNASEELSKLTNGSYQKIAGSRAISPHLKIDGSSCSHSFNILISGLNQLLLKLDS
jgi:hypothetical protein